MIEPYLFIKTVFENQIIRLEFCKNRGAFSDGYKADIVTR